MKRILEIIDEVRQQHPSDDFFSDFEESCRISGQKRRQYYLYNKALMALDDESWKILKDKALRHYLDHREGQKKQGFFNQLNEAFAYQYLVRRGFHDVRMIMEGTRTSPDIRFAADNIQYYCEVKTLGISDDEVNRRTSPEAYKRVFDGTDYVNLTEKFFNKFCEAVTTAERQIRTWGPSGLVYVIVRFDDMALDYYQNYRKQIVQFIKRRGFENLFIKVGVGGNRSISYKLSPRTG